MINNNLFKNNNNLNKIDMNVLKEFANDVSEIDISSKKIEGILNFNRFT